VLHRSVLNALAAMSQMTQAAALILLKQLFNAKRTQSNASTMGIMFVQATSF